VTPCGRLSGQAWEQLELPLDVGDAWLLNPCNVGPILTRRSVVTIHDAQVYLAPEAYTRAFRSWYKTILPILGRRARIVTTVSKFSKDTLEAYGVVPRGKAHVVPNGADHILRIESDPQALQRFGLSPGRYLLAVGSLSPHKNLRSLIAAAGLRRDRSIPLVVAGGAAPRIFADAGMPKTPDLHYLGRVTDAELRSLYENAAAFLFPSLVEGFGLPPVEAMACGCPVIASSAASLPEVCGGAALYADPFDIDAWARLMDEVTVDAELRARLREAGHKRATGYTWRNAALSLLRLIAAADGDADAVDAIDRLRTGDGPIVRQPSRAAIASAHDL
jgi:glycosyltransferase involved in cell wall biosynthesis